jgi:hypothetical protein
MLNQPSTLLKCCGRKNCLSMPLKFEDEAGMPRGYYGNRSWSHLREEQSQAPESVLVLKTSLAIPKRFLLLEFSYMRK